MEWRNVCQPRGPGTELKKILSLWGFKEKKGCSCDYHITKMNVKGANWCRKNLGKISNWLHQSAEKNEIPFSQWVTSKFIRRAIKRSEAVPNLNGVFDAVYCVSLDRRPDRWERFKGQVPEDWPFGTIKRISAIDGKKVPHPEWWRQGGGAWGCYRTHLSLIEEALNTRKESILLMEDDAVFCDDFSRKVTEFMEALPSDWEMIYFGGQHLGVELKPPLKVNELVFRPYNINRTHAFALRGSRMMGKVYKHLNKHEWSPGYHIDHQLGIIHQRRQDAIFAPNEWLVGQAQGKSNVSGRMAPERYWISAQKVHDLDPSNLPFIAVLGIHSSGSSCLAGMLYHLGLFLGNNLVGYYGNNPSGNCGFEAAGLANICEKAVPFANTEYGMDKGYVWQMLKGFLNQKRREAFDLKTIAAGKYPQLCQLGQQLINICGENLYVVTSDRPIEDSISSLTRRCLRNHPDQIRKHQEWLEEGKEWVVSQLPPEKVLRVNYYDLLEDPDSVIDRFAKFTSTLDLPFNRNAEDKTFREAVRRWVDPSKEHVRNPCDATDFQVRPEARSTQLVNQR